jgi:hypothetical protein
VRYVIAVVTTYFIHSLLQTAVEVISMVPKNGTETWKRVPLLSTMEWHAVRSRLARAMGYDSDEEDQVVMTYCFSNALKSSCDTLEDNDDYQGIISIMQARCASLAPLTVEIQDANVCFISISCNRGSHIPTERKFGA